MTAGKTQIRSDLQTTGQILSKDFRYFVPAHQRSYSWTLEEVKQLWEDVADAIRDGVSEYFLGTIVVQENREDKTRTIIDGQQRLATLTMILAAVRSVYEAHDDDRAKEVYDDYLGSRDRRTRISEPRVSLNELNERTFQRLVVDDSSDADLANAEADRGLAPSNTLIAKAAHFVRQAVRQEVKKSKSYETFLLSLEEFVSNQIVLILVAVGDEADAYLIFETLNDRGLELSISDLLKNYLLGRAGRRLDAVRRQWQEMALILNTQDQTQFLRHYWLSKYGVVRERDLYKEMKRKFSSQSSVLQLMGELRDSAETYAAICNSDHALWKDYSVSVRKNLDTLQLFGLTQFRPLLLAAIETLEEQEVPKIVRLLVVVSMRYSIIGGLGPGNIERAYSNAARRVRDGGADTANKVFSELKELYPNDARFEADFAEKEISKAKLARYVLTELANSIQGSSELTVLEDASRVNLEHVMPKTRGPEWLDATQDEEEYVEYVDRLGNLTLIERGKNLTAGNASFEQKKTQAFDKSDILMTKQLCQYPEWNVGRIAERQHELSKVAIDVWSLPY